MGNTAALTHGLRSERARAEIETYRQNGIEELFRERGGRSALDWGSRIVVENFAVVATQHRLISDYLDVHGPPYRRRSSPPGLRLATFDHRVA